MRRLSVMFAGLIMLTALWTSVAFAGTTASTMPYPKVTNLWPFSPAANFMSLPGYLGYLSFQRLGHWLTYTQATRMVQEERGQ